MVYLGPQPAAITATAIKSTGSKWILDFIAGILGFVRD
jgi:hypothetical protein